MSCRIAICLCFALLVAAKPSSDPFCYSISQLQKNEEAARNPPPPLELGPNLVSTQDLIAQEDATSGQAALVPQSPKAPAITIDELVAKRNAGTVINFNNVNVVELLRFVSRITGKNFIFDPTELDFTVTVIAENPASIEDVMAATLQVLTIHGFFVIENGPGFLIHKDKDIKSPAGLYTGDSDVHTQPQIATKVFAVNYVDVARLSSIISTMTSKDAIVEVVPETKRLIVTDLAINVKKIGELIIAIDTPNVALEVGQYVVQNSTPASLMAVAEKVLLPLVSKQSFVMIPHVPSNSIYVVSSPFFVNKALAVMQLIDLNENYSRMFAFEELTFNQEVSKQQYTATQQAEDQQLLAQGGFTDEEINQLTDDQIKQILTELGYSPSDIASFTEDHIRTILKTAKLGPIGRSILVALRRKTTTLFESGLPLGEAESTQFFIYKLQYRDCDEVVKALHAVAATLVGPVRGAPAGGPGAGAAAGASPALSPATTGAAAATAAAAGPSPLYPTSSSSTDLIITLNSIQAISESNSLVMSGTRETLAKIKELIGQIDIPVRQVFIEVLALDTTIVNSMNYGVEWGEKTINNGTVAVQGGFFQSGGPTSPALAAVSQTSPNPLSPIQPPGPGLFAGSIGRKIAFGGNGYYSIAGFVTALRSDDDTNIIFNQRVTVEHNVPATVYVGQQVGIKGQTVANNTGQVLASNFETRNTGLTLTITALIGSHNTVTLIINQTISSVSPQQIAQQGGSNSVPATINQTNTQTRVHLPSEHFIVLSGMINDQRELSRSYVPCLGGFPLVGNLFATNNLAYNKRNVTIFLRPTIIDTDIDIDDISSRQAKIQSEKDTLFEVQRGPMDDLRTLLNLQEPMIRLPPPK